MRALIAGLLLVTAACGSDSPPASPPEPPPPREEPSPPEPSPPEPSPPPREAPDALACDGATRVRVTDDRTVELTPDLGLGSAHVSWRADLNGDGAEDLALRFADACGNWGDCPYAVMAACGETRYAVVWGPEYCVEVEVGESSGEGWAELLAVDRQGEKASRRAWRFENGRYRPADSGR